MDDLFYKKGHQKLIIWQPINFFYLIQMEQKEFKICLIGGPKTGKTTFLTEMLNDSSTNQYQPTQGISIKDFVIETNHGVYKLSLWDTGGLYRGLESCYYLNSHAALSFYDGQCHHYDDPFVKEYHRVIENGPIINIISGRSREKFMRSTYSMTRRPTYCYQPKNGLYGAPMVHLMQKLTGHSDLVIH